MDVHLRVIIYEPGEPGRVVEIASTVEAIQEVVGGFFEVFWDEATRAYVYVNEDGLARKLRPNRRFGQHDVVGVAVFTTHDQYGDTTGLGDDDVVRIRAAYG